MRQIRIAIIATLFAFSSLVSAAEDFTVTSKDGRQMHFNVLDEKAATVELVSGSNYTPSGTLTIPVAVKHGDKAYTVVSIGERALAGADMLKSIVLPSNIKKIEAAAFENCIFLTEVILPGSNIAIAEDAFKGCSALSSVKFGSDCTYIDFTPFKYCSSLKEINIPAKAKVIAGLSSLTSVNKVSVDEANPYYVSVADMLYDKTAAELVYCPIDCPRELVIPEGTYSIRRGALAACSYVEKIALPSSLKTVAYDEFAGMQNLESISFASEKVSVTGTKNGRDVFALEIGSDVDIYVQKKSLQYYRMAIEDREGIYESLDGKERKNVSADQLADAKQVKKAKRNSI